MRKVVAAVAMSRPSLTRVSRSSAATPVDVPAGSFSAITLCGSLCNVSGRDHTTTLSQREGYAVLNGAQGQRRLHADHAGQMGQRLGMDALQVRPVLEGDMQKVIRLPRQQIARQHFRQIQHRLFEAVERLTVL